MGRNVTISISDRSSGAVFHLSVSLEPGRKTWLFVNTRSSYLGRPRLSIPSQSSANDTWRRPGRDGGPRGLQHQCEYSLALSGHLWELFDKKTAIRNTSDAPAWKETPLRVGSGHSRALLGYIYMYVSVCVRESERMSLGMVTFWLVCGFIRKGMPSSPWSKGW